MRFKIWATSIRTGERGLYGVCNTLSDADRTEAELRKLGYTNIFMEWGYNG